jgi:hypothetical protein
MLSAADSLDTYCTGCACCFEGHLQLAAGHFLQQNMVDLSVYVVASVGALSR